MLCSIIIPTYNHLESDLKPCLQSIKASTDMSLVEIIISANGCTDGTEAYVESLGAPFKLISNKEALGYPRAINAGMELACGDFICLLNNDLTFLDNSWLDKMIKPFMDRDGETVGVTGPTKRFWSHHPHIVFFCAMFRRSLWNQIGPLDTAFSPGAGEDVDFCLKAGKLGLRMVQVPDDHEKQEMPCRFPIWHKGSQTVNEIAGWADIGARNRAILDQRYPRYIPAPSIVEELKLEVEKWRRLYFSLLDVQHFHANVELMKSGRRSGELPSEMIVEEFQILQPPDTSTQSPTSISSSAS